MDAYICMAESFCFSAETITAFFFLLKVYLFWLPGCEPAFSSCNKHASHCSDLLLWSMVSRCTGFGSCGTWALELGLSICDPWA